MQLQILGGAGESGRACFALDQGKEAVLLDCGVKRVITPNQVGQYPLLTPELARRLRLALLSHVHEDHAAALPLLPASGYTGKISASEWTALRAADYVRKWQTYATAQGGQIPFSPADTDRLQLEPLPGLGADGACEVNGIHVRWGRTGHIPGSLWFDLQWHGVTCFYSGDWCPGSALLGADLPPTGRRTVAIIDAAYGTDRRTRAEYEAELWEAALAVLKRGGRVLLPMPGSGRTQDWLLFLAGQSAVLRELGAPVWVEPSLLAALEEYRLALPWLHADGSAILESLPHNLFQPPGPASAAGPAVWLVADGMLTGESGLQALATVAGDPRSAVFLTGHQAPGTPGAELLAGRLPAICCQVAFYRLKVHPSLTENLDLLARVEPDQVILAHAAPERASPLAEHLQSLGYAAVLPRPGESFALRCP